MTEILKRNRPGMTSVKDMPVLQDVPPPGGFPAIRVERRLPSTGPTGVTIFAVSTAVMAYGYYKVWQLTKERRLDAEEHRLVRESIVPALQAEADLMWVQAHRQRVAEEEKLMAKVAGWKPVDEKSTLRWIPPLKQGGVWDPVLL